MASRQNEHKDTRIRRRKDAKAPLKFRGAFLGMAGAEPFDDSAGSAPAWKLEDYSNLSREDSVIGLVADVA